MGQITANGESSEYVFMCDLSALTADERAHHIAASKTFFAQVLDIRELDNGYALRLPDTPEILTQVADFIRYERLCCPFIAFGLHVAPHGGGIELTLSGADGIKPFLFEEFGGHLLHGIVNAPS